MTSTAPKPSRQRSPLVVGALVIVVALICITTLFIVLSVRVSTNDHAKIERDRDVKIKCVEAGKQIIANNCIAGEVK